MSGIYVHFLPSRSEIRFTKCFRRELDRPIYQVPDRTCPTKGFFGDTKVLGDAFQDAKRKRATRKVRILCFKFSLNPLRFSLMREIDTKMTTAKS